MKLNSCPKDSLILCCMLGRKAMKHVLFKYIFFKKKLCGVLKFQRWGKIDLRSLSQTS